MMETLFLQVLNLSFTGGIVILFVLAARLLLRRGPKACSYALWAVVLFRLLCPFSFESVLSFLPANPQPIPHNIVYEALPKVDTGVSVLNRAVNSALPPAAPYASVNPLQVWVWAGAFVWCAGIAVLLIYSLLALWKLRRRLGGAVLSHKNIWICGQVETAFVLGIFRPRIYLPMGLTEKETEYILLHEQSHIRRGDHIVKLVSFLVLCIHWFNPLVWLAFFLSARDMEMACDESVVKRLGGAVKREYSASLLAMATGRWMIGGTPLAFGEGDTKGRVKNVLNYKRPTLWVLAVTVILVAAIMAGLGMNPKKPASRVNTMYSAVLSPEQKAEMAVRYQLAEDSNIFETKFHVSDQFKSYAYYVDLYQYGTQVGSYLQVFGNFEAREGSIVTAFSMNRGESGRWESMDWTVSMIDSGYGSQPGVSFPEGFVPQGFATSTLTNEGNAKEMPVIVPEQPLIIAAVGMNSAENNEIESYSCTYLMEHPEVIAQYECVYLVRCVFSEKDEMELSQTLPAASAGETDGYLTTFELYNKGEMVQSSYSLLTETATELPALLLKGTDKTVPSVNDAPNEEEYLKITIGEHSDTIYYVYRSDDKYWVEKPYDYKRELDQDTYTALMDYLTTLSDSMPDSFNPTEVDAGLDAAVSAAVLEYHGGQYAKGEFAAEAHRILASEKMEPSAVGQPERVTVYVQARYIEFGFPNDSITNAGGGMGVNALVFEMMPSGEYRLLEYWDSPKDEFVPLTASAQYKPRLTPAEFPARPNDSQLLTMVCYDQAVTYGKVPTGQEVARLLDVICSSPKQESAPLAYKKAHPSEYQELVSYGDYTLRECFARFEEGGQTGLEGHIMASACQEILMVKYGLTWESAYATGQEWFDAVKSSLPFVNKPLLTLSEVKKLAQAGNKLTWSDFEAYESSDIGSGLYILAYPLSDTEEYVLIIGGGDRKKDPMYIRLVRSGNTEEAIDIRTEDIGAFCMMNRRDAGT